MLEKSLSPLDVGEKNLSPEAGGGGETSSPNQITHTTHNISKVTDKAREIG